jgi:hypothetical protein
MRSTTKGIVLQLVVCCATFVALWGISAAPACAEPSLLVYPSQPAEFHYNPAEYELISPADPAYDSNYDVGGYMLWNKVEERIPYEVYRAPAITVFKPSSNGLNEFVMLVNHFTLVIDGYFEYPRQLPELLIRFTPDPPHASALIILNSQPIDYLVTSLPGFDVHTPTPEGNYSDTEKVSIGWSASAGLRISVFGDKNGNGIYDGGVPKWSVYVVDNTVPVRESTWGEIKAIYGSQ